MSENGGFDPYLSCSGCNIIPHARGVILRAGLNSELADEYRAFVDSLRLSAPVTMDLNAVYSHRRAAQNAARALPEGPAKLGVRAAQLVLLSRHGEARALLDRAVRLDPRSAWLAYWRAFTTYADARLRRRPEVYPRALEEITRAIALAPGEVWFYLLRASLFADFGRADDAVADFDRALALRPDLGRAVFEKARLLAESERYEEAQPVVARLLQLFPGSGFARAVSALAAIEAKRIPEALAEIDAAVALEPRSGVLRAWRGEIRRKAGLYQEALPEFDIALDELKARDPLHHAWRGKTRLTLGDAAGAARDLSRAARDYPQYQSAFSWRAEALWKLGRARAALADLERVLPLNLETSWSCAAAHGDAERSAKRKARFLEELRAGPAGSWADAFRGAALAPSSDPALRREAEGLLRAAARGAAAVPARTHLGRLLAAAGRFEEALALLRRAVRDRPDSAQCRFLLAEALAGAGRDAAALREARAAIGRDGFLRPAWTLAAGAAARSGRKDEARTLLEVAVCLEPRKAEAFRLRAGLRRGEGDLEGSRADLLAALRLTPAGLP